MIDAPVYDYHIENVAMSIDLELKMITQKFLDAGFNACTIELTPDSRYSTADIHLWRGQELYSVSTYDGDLSPVRRDSAKLGLFL